MTMRTLALAVLVSGTLAATSMVGVARAQVTDCTNYPVGTSCKPLASPTGTTGTCQESSNFILGGMVCVANATPSFPTSGTPTQTQTTGVNTSQTQTTGVNTGSNVTLINPLNAGTSLGSFLLNILQFVVYIGSIVVVLMIVFVGYKFVAARGNPTGIEEARTMLLWTVIGALILLGAEAIAQGICATVQALSNGTGSCG